MAPRKLTLEDYDITRDGKVINKNTGYQLTPQLNGKGYLRVSIGKQLMFVHRLVAEKYIPNPDNKTQVNHKDGNKLNNCVDNLEWCTKSYNVSYSKSIKIKQIDPITKEVINIYDSAIRAAIAVSGKNGCILMCCKRIKYNTYKGFIWRFIDDNDYSIKHKSKIVRIYNDAETIYNSINEAAIKNNVSASAIYNCLYGKSKTCGGYEWIKR